MNINLKLIKHYSIGNLKIAQIVSCIYGAASVMLTFGPSVIPKTKHQSRLNYIGEICLLDLVLMNVNIYSIIKHHTKPLHLVLDPQTHHGFSNPNPWSYPLNQQFALILTLVTCIAWSQPLCPWSISGSYPFVQQFTFTFTILPWMPGRHGGSKCKLVSPSL